MPDVFERLGAVVDEHRAVYVRLDVVIEVVAGVVGGASVIRPMRRAVPKSFGSAALSG
jgi:hypothetical protein